jgi:membrane-associated phospholipid phosphatase
VRRLEGNRYEKIEYTSWPGRPAAVWAIGVRRQGWLTVVSILWALAIGFSILQLRRHLFIALRGGGVLAWGCGWLASAMQRSAMPA